MENRPRNKEGKFVKFSPLGDKNIGLRLYKEDQEIFLKIAKEFDMSPTELARYAIREWLKMKNTNKSS
ncbi:MAG: hypothetical protein AB4206_21290 [Xenococcaceae cyanobacterium]